MESGDLEIVFVDKVVEGLSDINMDTTRKLRTHLKSTNVEAIDDLNHIIVTTLEKSSPTKFNNVMKEAWYNSLNVMLSVDGEDETTIG